MYDEDAKMIDSLFNIFQNKKEKKNDHKFWMHRDFLVEDVNVSMALGLINSNIAMGKNKDFYINSQVGKI